MNVLFIKTTIIILNTFFLDFNVNYIFIYYFSYDI